MKIKPRKYRVPPGKKVKLRKWPTLVKPYYGSKNDYQRILDEHIAGLSKAQSLLYADGRHSLLVIFQAMDAAGKDGVIEHVMSGVNPQGCQVYSFKHPSVGELSHDFLWRTTRCLPERGRIGIFNRSYYEEVLIVRVHPEILRAEPLPAAVLADKDIWDTRYRSIRDLERHLDCNGTRIVKIYLHLSKEEQRKRFLARIDDPGKNWKFSQSDLSERARWDDYADAYEKCLAATSSREAPWYVVPADDKLNARLIVSRIILETIGELALAYPTSPAQRRGLLAIRRQLANESAAAKH
jgi:PPK2 family polyphosphate:nucleotide phosphotransferase